MISKNKIIYFIVLLIFSIVLLHSYINIKPEYFYNIKSYSQHKSININNIYCNHWLKNKRLKEFCKNPKFESFVYPEHSPLTSFHVKDTIHYNALINDNYKNYEEYRKTTQKEYSIDYLKNLKNNFDINKMKKIKVKYNFEKNKYIVKDGVHRLSILLYKNIINDNVPIKYLDIQ